MVLLRLQELFILCHELGHFFNGDLEEQNNLVKLWQTNWAVVNENKDHQIEYKADLTGFDILTRIGKKKFNLDRKYVLLQVMAVFDILAMIDPSESKDHPAPIDRTCNIIQHFFGEKYVQQYVKTYYSEVIFSEFFNSLN
jgi:hypothetical protein